jgi:copper(I)-binding protein
MITRLAPFTAALVLTALPALAQGPSALTARDAWVREAPASRPTSAAYLVLENGSASDIVVVSASTPAAKVVELHEMRDEDGKMRMRKVEKIVVPAKGSVTLKPGGLHVMLFELTGALEAGKLVPFTFTLADGKTLTVEAQVRAGGGMH